MRSYNVLNPDDASNATTSLTRRHAAALVVGATASLGTNGLNESAARTQIAADIADPIFAVIQRHKELYAAFEAAVHARNEREEALPPEKHSWSWSVDDRVPPNDPKLDPQYLALDIRVGELSEGHADACRALLDVQPTTLQGVAALLRYTYEVVAAGDDWAGYLGSLFSLEDWNSELHRKLANTITNIAAALATPDAKNDDRAIDRSTRVEPTSMAKRAISSRISLRQPM
jgi:hypothetical protein